MIFFWYLGKCLSLGDAIKILLPEIFKDKPLASDDISKAEVEECLKLNPEAASNIEGTQVIAESKDVESCNLPKHAEIDRFPNVVAASGWVNFVENHEDATVFVTP